MSFRLRRSSWLPAGLVLAGLVGADGHPDGFATVTVEDLFAHVSFLASPELEGRDTPSAGLARAADYAVQILKQAGFVDIAEVTEDLRWTYVQKSSSSGPFAIPFPNRCHFAIEREGLEREKLEYGVDFLPVPGGGGKARGVPVFLGFGIDSDKHPYNDLRGREWRGKIAVFFEGEPRHPKLFEGPTVTREADLYRKIAELEKRGALGVLCIRRPPELPEEKREVEPGPTPLSFRHSWASFLGQDAPRIREFDIPALEITVAAAQKLFGGDLLEVAGNIDTRGRPQRMEVKGLEIDIASATGNGEVEVQNVVGVLPGSDPELADEFVVIGAHYDHLGVDPRGRIGTGADDNASGVSAILELAQALGVAKPRRSIMVTLFAGEEDGLRGSRALCANPPVAPEQMVAMINMDMLGRGKRDELLAIGLAYNPGMSRLLKRAKKLERTGIKKLVTNRGQDLFQRSDHYAFHQLGVPALFFFEGWPLSKNKDYHSFDDRVERLDMDKIWHSTRLLFNLVWLLSNDDSRPPKPR